MNPRVHTCCEILKGYSSIKKLVLNVVFHLDFEWCLSEEMEAQERGRFFLIILNLATIEVTFLLQPPMALVHTGILGVFIFNFDDIYNLALIQ